jgi:hypothetical protein
MTLRMSDCVATPILMESRDDSFTSDILDKLVQSERSNGVTWIAREFLVHILLDSGSGRS